MLFNQTVILRHVGYIKDAMGELEPDNVESKQVCCDVESVGRNEFYQAQTAGYRPEIIFKIRKALYSEQQEVEYAGNRYTVIRTYAKDPEIIELICRKGVR